MALRTILTFPNPVLQKAAKPVERFDAELKKLVEDMIDTMRAAPGIGLAAPQVGVGLRVIVLEVPGEDETVPPVLCALCNPEITRREGEAKTEEGCLSCPGFYVEVDRAKEVTVVAKLPDGSPFKIDADGLLSICFQHEMDHLDGKLLVNYVSTVKRNLYRDELKRRKSEDETPDRARAL
jgi:peptide deformylase